MLRAEGSITMTLEHLTYRVDGMSCEHCRVAVAGEVSQVAGVRSVDVDLETRLVRVEGTGVEPAAVGAATDEAAYEGVPAGPRWPSPRSLPRRWSSSSAWRSPGAAPWGRPVREPRRSR